MFPLKVLGFTFFFMLSPFVARPVSYTGETYFHLLCLSLSYIYSKLKNFNVLEKLFILKSSLSHFIVYTFWSKRFSRLSENFKGFTF